MVADAVRAVVGGTGLVIRHALCVDCGDVLHVVGYGSSELFVTAVEAGTWAARLGRGCATCGGLLTDFGDVPCDECAEWETALEATA